MIIYFEADMDCGLREAHDLESGRKAVIKEVGTAFFRKAREATQEDINNVRAMGGYVPSKEENVSCTLQMDKVDFISQREEIIKKELG